MPVKNLGLRHYKIRIIPNIEADKEREKKNIYWTVKEEKKQI